MHFNFGFTTVQVLWTLTFAALLVLLVVLLGRDRARRFPLFTASIVLVALRLLASRMLFGRMAPMTSSTIFLALADVAALVSMLVVVEMARRAFAGIKPRTWLIGTLAMLAVGGAVLAKWGPWPAWSTLTAQSNLALLRVMQLFAQKGDMLACLLAVELGLLVILLGRRFKAGWRSHTQQIVIGISTAALAQLAVRGIWQAIVLTAVPHSEAEYQRIMGLQEKLYNANSVVYIAVLVWWIACLWIDEPGMKQEALAEKSAAERVYLEPGVAAPAPADAPAEK
jgi:hypothetical protein